MQAERALAALRGHFGEDSGSDTLARAARGGDLEAFEGLVRRYQRRVYALAYQHLRDPVEAQDLAQEVFVRLYRNLERYDPERPFEPWFWRLAANVAATYRRQRPAPALELPDVAEATSAARDEALPLARALADLSDDLRLPILLHYYLDLPLEEIAEAMGLSLSAVKSRLHRARALLRRLLVEE
jgi:RNA polymerase sigma-70 factor, ECF subfamily